MDDIRIRAATLQDADTLTRFNLAMAQETEDRALDESTVRAGVSRLLNDPTRGVYYVAERDGNVLGQLMVTYEWSDWRDGVFWWIQSVYVRPECRGAGVYRRLHEWVAQLARRNGRVCGLRLYVEQDNRAAQQVYERMGMRCTAYRLYETDWSAGPRLAPGRDDEPAAADGITSGWGKPGQATAGGVIAVDLYCLKCGYNLRGLSGDPCRCPECGNLNPRGDMELPAALISRQLREMESGPAYCVGAMLLLVLLGIGTLVAPAGFLTGFFSAGLVLFWGGAIGWCIGVAMFRRSCLAKPGWLGTLARYHIAGLSALLLVVAIPTLSGIALRQLVGRVFDATAMATYTLLMIALAAVIAALLFLGVQPLKRLAKGKMEELQREVAVDIARRALQRRLARRSAWGWD